MLTRAGAIVESSSSEVSAELMAWPQVLCRPDAAEDIRRRRAEGTLDLSFGARPFILCGLPNRPASLRRSDIHASQRQVLFGDRGPIRIRPQYRSDNP